MFLYFRIKWKPKHPMNFAPFCFQSFRSGGNHADSLEDLLEDFEEDI
jgi:hypothetical protein